MAIARAAPGPAGQIELCTGSGPIMVYVDEAGAPVGPPHLCPDFALSLLLKGGEPQQQEWQAEVSRRLAPVRADLQNTRMPLPRVQARAPPRTS
ncbi:hypothetical protein [Microbulbifer sp. S227A]|uniref:hypothetical protein n=1 Tax=Microbulbifer sp. S227A TaxID=3415131 RepID=UPI003C7E7914